MNVENRPSMTSTVLFSPTIEAGLKLTILLGSNGVSNFNWFSRTSQKFVAPTKHYKHCHYKFYNNRFIAFEISTNQN